MVKLVALCAEGLEDFVAQKLDVTSYESYPGIILFEYAGDSTRFCNFKFADDVLFLVKKYSGIS
ncbi:hypothetical protein JXC34_04490, partial [Candidatus Woesearchaeota archaeon]|nr:hypothetical protein [Candidatus Woesearchaeota archaeon]